MKRRIGLILALAIPVALLADSANDANQELKALEGKWKAVAMEAGGQSFPKESVPDFTFIVAATGEAIGQSPQGEYQATITVDPKKSPRAIDNLHESGAQKGKKQYGIYKLEGDKWTVCMTLPGVAEGDRPKDFGTKDTANVVFVFELAGAGLDTDRRRALQGSGWVEVQGGSFSLLMPRERVAFPGAASIPS